MSAQKVQNALDGKIALSDCNAEDFSAFNKAQREALDSARSPANSAQDSQIDPLGQRDVHAQSKKDVKSPRAGPAQRSFAPQSKPLFKSEQVDEATNAMRLANGEFFLTDIVSFGKSIFIPDATHYSLAVDAIDRIMVNTPKFIDAAEFWHPLVSRYYFSVLFFIQVFRAQRESGTLRSENAIFLSDFESHYRNLQLPVPGPLIPFLTSISASSPLLLDYEDISPWLPPTPVATEATFYQPYANLSSRIPQPRVLLDQHRAYLRALTTAADDAARKNVCLQWPSFLARIHEQAGHATPANNDRAHSPFSPFAAPPTTAYERSAINADTNAQMAVRTPFQTRGFTVTSRSLNPILDSRIQMQAIIPVSLTIDATAANRSTVSLTWRQYLGLDDYEYFDEILRVMTLYCKHLKNSTIIGAIPPVGHTAGQNVAVKVALAAAPTTRFENINHTFRVQGRNNQLPAADNSDAAITAINYQWHNVAWNDSNNTTDEVFNTAGTGRLRGPFFHKLPLIKRSDTVSPSTSYSSIITDYYHMQTIRS